MTGSGISKLVFTILSAVAEAERDRIRERITDVKRDQKQQVRYLGGKVPFGHAISDDGSLLPVPGEQQVIQRAVALRQAGRPLRAIQGAVLSEFERKLSLDALSRIVKVADE